MTNKEKDALKLVDITSENWEDVIFLTTNETITVKGSDEPFAIAFVIFSVLPV